MAVWNSSGQSIASWIKPTLLFALPTACFVALLTLYIVPWADRSVEDMKQKLETQDDISSAPSGVFIESRSGDSVIFIDALDRETGKFSGVFFFGREGELATLVSAGRGQSQGGHLSDNYLLVEGGNRYDINSETNEIDWTKFSKYGVRIDRPVGSSAHVHQSGKPTSTLLLEPSDENHAELVWRFGLPISTLLLALLCLSITFEQMRGGKSYAVGVGALLFITYKNVLAIAEVQVSQGSWTPWQGFIVPHVPVLFVSSLLLLWRSQLLRFVSFKLVAK